MKRRALIVAALASPVIAHAQQSVTTDLFAMQVGERRMRSARGVQSYSLGGGDIVDVRIAPDGASFVFSAVGPGQTVILLIFQDGHQVRCQFTIRA